MRVGCAWVGAGFTSRADVGARRRRRQRRRARELCLELQRRHNVVPRVSWGTLPDSQRESWQVLKCNEQIEGAAVALSSQEDTVVAGRSDSLAWRVAAWRTALREAAVTSPLSMVPQPPRYAQPVAWWSEWMRRSGAWRVAERKGVGC
jgi:hypothetical protein